MSLKNNVCMAGWVETFEVPPILNQKEEKYEETEN